jgi:hypothetical protein
MDQVSACCIWAAFPALDVFVLRALQRDQKGDVEREQALKFVRAFLDLPKCAHLLPQCIVSAVLSLAEQPEEKFRAVAVETVCEMAARNVEHLHRCGGLRILFQSMMEGPPVLSKVLTLTVSQLLDRPDSRRFIRPDVDVEVLNNRTMFQLVIQTFVSR